MFRYFHLFNSTQLIKNHLQMKTAKIIFPMCLIVLLSAYYISNINAQVPATSKCVCAYCEVPCKDIKKPSDHKTTCPEYRCDTCSTKTQKPSKVR